MQQQLKRSQARKNCKRERSFARAWQVSRISTWPNHRFAAPESLRITKGSWPAAREVVVFARTLWGSVVLAGVSAAAVASAQQQAATSQPPAVPQSAVTRPYDGIQ